MDAGSSIIIVLHDITYVFINCILTMVIKAFFSFYSVKNFTNPMQKLPVLVYLQEMFLLLELREEKPLSTLGKILRRNLWNTVSFNVLFLYVTICIIYIA